MECPADRRSPEQGAGPHVSLVDITRWCCGRRVHNDELRFVARITRRFLRNRTNPTRRYESTKQPEMRFRAQLVDESLELELALV